MAKIQNTDTTTCWENVEQQELLFTARGNQSVLQYNILEKQNYGTIKKISGFRGWWLGDR